MSKKRLDEIVRRMDTLVQRFDAHVKRRADVSTGSKELDQAIRLMEHYDSRQGGNDTLDSAIRKARSGNIGAAIRLLDQFDDEEGRDMTLDEARALLEKASV